VGLRYVVSVDSTKEWLGVFVVGVYLAGMGVWNWRSMERLLIQRRSGDGSYAEKY
jgi:hypothetical protein